VAKKKRHREAEIAVKLAEADILAKQGRNQSQIAKALGVSVMTYHRWRKAQPHRPPAATVFAALANPRLARDGSGRTAELQSENARLRKLVTDLLLEKMRIEEELSGELSSPTRAR